MTLQAPKREEVVRARRISLIPAETSFFFSRILRHCALFEFGTTQRHSTYRSYPRGYLGLRFTAVSTLLDEIMKWILTRIVLGVTRSNRMITRGVAWLFLFFFVEATMFFASLIALLVIVCPWFHFWSRTRRILFLLNLTFGLELIS